MTFAAFETSIEGSRPVEVYQIIVGSELHRWTSAEDTVSVGGVDYEPMATTRGRVGQSREERQSTLELTVPPTFKFARQYIANVPGSQARLTVTRVQRSDFPGPETIQIFEGNVQSVAFSKNALEAKIAAIPLSSAMSRAIPRFTYKGLCNNVLYDDGCKVDRNDAAFQHTATVSAVSGNTITVPGATAFGADWFVGGYVSFADNDFRMIVEQSGDILTLLLPFPTDVNGEEVDIQAGCDHDINGDCDNKFFTPEDVTSNVINYGGFAFVPRVNPFQSGLDASTNPCPP